jgi:CRP/FNR family cyclic AMP-dependent transcriptional regulator
MADALVDLIRSVPLFSELDKRELKAVADSMKERTFAAGSAVTQEGQSGVGFFIVAAGSATVTVGGKEVGRVGPGDYFGEVALVADVDRTATITADTDLRCYGMTAWDFRPLVQKHASIAWKLLQTLGRRLADAERRNAS